MELSAIAPSGGIMANKPLLFGIVIAGAAAVWYFFLRKPTEVVAAKTTSDTTTTDNSSKRTDANPTGDLPQEWVAAMLKNPSDDSWKSAIDKLAASSFPARKASMSIQNVINSINSSKKATDDGYVFTDSGIPEGASWWLIIKYSDAWNTINDDPALNMKMWVRIIALRECIKDKSIVPLVTKA